MKKDDLEKNEAKKGDSECWGEAQGKGYNLKFLFSFYNANA